MARTQDEGAAIAASRTRTPPAAILAGLTGVNVCGQSARPRPMARPTPTVLRRWVGYHAPALRRLSVAGALGVIERGRGRAVRPVGGDRARRLGYGHARLPRRGVADDRAIRRRRHPRPCDPRRPHARHRPVAAARRDGSQPGGGRVRAPPRRPRVGRQAAGPGRTRRRDDRGVVAGAQQRVHAALRRGVLPGRPAGAAPPPPTRTCPSTSAALPRPIPPTTATSPTWPSPSA